MDSGAVGTSNVEASDASAITGVQLPHRRQLNRRLGLLNAQDVGQGS